MSYWSRQQMHVTPQTLAIVELMKEGVPFSEWDLESKQLLAYSVSPKQQNAGGERWCTNSRHGLKLIQHLFKNGSHLRLPPALREVVNSIDDAQAAEITNLVAVIRKELHMVTPPYILDGLF